MYYNKDKYDNQDPESVALKSLEILIDFGKNNQIQLRNRNNCIDKMNSSAYITLVINVSE